MSPRETEDLRTMRWPKVTVAKWEAQILAEKATISLPKAAKQLYATN